MVEFRFKRTLIQIAHFHGLEMDICPTNTTQAKIACWNPACIALRTKGLPKIRGEIPIYSHIKAELI